VRDSVDFVMLPNDTLDLLERDIVALDARFTGSLLPVGRVTTTNLVPLFHHGAVVLVNPDFLLLIHDDYAFCRQLLI
jgi:hypothetical protein